MDPQLWILTSVVLAAALLVVTLYLVLRVFRPLRAIAEAARRFSRGELTYRLELDAPPQLRAVADALNGMARQVDETITRISSQRNEVEAVFGSMVEGVVVVDRQRVINSLNSAAAVLFGRTPAEVKREAHRGKSVIEFLRNTDVDSFAGQVLEEQTALERTVTLYRKAPVYVQIHGTVLRDEQGECAGALLVLNDITRLKRLENMRRDFVANVSHELRTPITSIMGFVETLLEDDPGDEETRQRFLGIAHGHAQRLNLIIEDLLSLSRLESWEGELPREDCALEQIVSRTIGSCEAAAQRRGIAIRDSYVGATRVSVNENLLEQALVNLVNNAVKYSNQDSVVEIVCRNDGQELQISVRDQGPGIPPADQLRVFERFYRVDRARSRAMGGTGLGLAIVKHIALAHNGEVSVTSMEGQGSVFTLCIPSPLS